MLDENLNCFEFVQQELTMKNMNMKILARQQYEKHAIEKAISSLKKENKIPNLYSYIKVKDVSHMLINSKKIISLIFFRFKI